MKIEANISEDDFKQNLPVSSALAVFFVECWSVLQPLGRIQFRLLKFSITGTNFGFILATHFCSFDITRPNFLDITASSMILTTDKLDSVYHNV